MRKHSIGFLKHFTVYFIITTNSYADDHVNNATHFGNFENNGVINNFVNNGIVNLNMENNKSGVVNGIMLNSSTGSVYNLLLNEGSVVGNMQNDGIANFRMENTSTGTINGNMLVGSTGTVNTFMANEGTIDGNMQNDGNVSGVVSNQYHIGTDLLNNGVIGKEMYNAVSGIISGNMKNSSSGIVRSYLENRGEVYLDVYNAGVVYAEFNNQNTGYIHGSMTNSGSIGAGMTNDGGTINGDMVNSGTIKNDMENDGVILGKMENTDSATILGNLVNKGSITNGIINGGVIKGMVSMGDSFLYLTGNTASITGMITGSDVSSISIGNNMTFASYEAAQGNDASAGSLIVTKRSQLTLDDGVTWTASGIDEAIINQGTVVLNNSSLKGNLNNTGTLTLGSEISTFATINGNVSNSGSIVLNPTDHSAGNTLTLNGNYEGLAGSRISLGTVLDGDNSLTDALVITGNTSGASTLDVANENGVGARTLEGIRVISVGGISDGGFALGSRVVAGAYDYTLRKGSGSGNHAGDWYLTSYSSPTPTPTPTPTQGTRMVRPEVGSYIANLRAANTLFSLSLRDREGEQNFAGTSARNLDTPGMWLRNGGGYNSISTSDGQNRTRSVRYILQLGGDLATWTTDGTDRVSLGLMGGYASQHSNTRNALTGNRSQSDVKGYSAGAYATWFQNAAEKTGFYADSWLQYGWFNNHVKGDDLDAERYRSQGLSASLESGYTLRVGKWKSEGGMDNALYVQPHAQAIWSDVHADGFRESNGTRVSGTGNDNVLLKLGVRTYLNGKSRLDRDTVREFQPFVEANWIYNTQEYGVRMNDDSFRASGERNVGELKTGVEAHLGQRVSGWVAVAQQIGGSGYSDTTGSLGLNYSF